LKRIIILIAALAALLGGLSLAPAGAQTVNDDGGLASCTTDANGYCTIPHSLGAAPTDVEATGQYPIGGTTYVTSSIMVDSVTATDFRVRIHSSDGSLVTSQPVRFYWHAWLRPSPPPSSTTTTTTGATTTTAVPPPPNVSDKLVPLHGAWWGDYVSSNTADVAPRETLAGRKFDIVQYYHDWNDTFPSAAEKSLSDGGRFLRLIFNGRDFSNSANNKNWCQIADGSQDTNIHRIASNVKAFGSKLFLTFHGEPEGSDGASCTGVIGTANGSGTLAQYVLAWRHIHDLFAADGVTNAVWVQSMANPSATTAAAAYVGDAFLDWWGWDPYNWYLCGGHSDAWISLSDKMASGYNWMEANHPGIPMMLGEHGSAQPSTASPSKGDWFRAIPADVAANRPDAKAYVYFDRVDGTCNWKVDSSADSMAGWQAEGGAAYFNQPHG